MYYDMKLVKLGINKGRNLIVLFPVFIQPYIQQHCIVSSRNGTTYYYRSQPKAHLYTHLLVERPSIALNSEKIYFLKTQGIQNMQIYWV